MIRTEAELHPPSVSLDKDISWVLLAAFADQYPQNARPATPERALDLTRTLTLVAPVSSRVPAEKLREALSPDLARQLTQQSFLELTRALAVQRARNVFCRAAMQCGVDVALLKQAALETAMNVAPGRRFATDVDVLVAPSDVPELERILLNLGCHRETKRTHSDGVVVIRTSDGVGIELHSRILGLKIGALRETADLETLRRHSQLRIVDPDQPQIHVPTAAVVAAQLVVQGWHLFHFVPNAPSHKSPMRVIADMLLLGLHKDVQLAEDVLRLIEHQVPEDEYRALGELALALSRGDFDGMPPAAKRALDHALGALTNEEYRRSLLLGRQKSTIQAEGLVSWTVRQMKRGVVPSDERLNHLVASGRVKNRLQARLLVPYELSRDVLLGLGASLLRRLRRQRP